MNIFKAMAVRSVEEATRAIPVIDFGPAFQGATGGLEAVAKENTKTYYSNDYLPKGLSF